MDPDAYRSYVIRVRRRSTGDPGLDRATTRLDVEDLIGGAKRSVSGVRAEALADQLERLTEGADAMARPSPGPAPAPDGAEGA